MNYSMRIVADPKKEIDALLPQVLPYDEQTSPYKMVVEQKTIRNNLDYLYALMASRKLAETLSPSKPPFVYVVSPPLYTANLPALMTLDIHHFEFGLKVEQCQYDNWNIPAVFDVSNDPDFADSHQKSYKIQIQNYNAHFGGW